MQLRENVTGISSKRFITLATTDKMMKDVFGSKDVHITLVRTVLGSRVYTKKKKNRKLKCSGL